MGYYVRVLSTSSDGVPFSALESTIEKNKFYAAISAEDGEHSD
jgi:hypothetical protein